MNEQDIKKDNLLPVHMVSAYHYIFRAQYRLYHTKGESDTYNMLLVGCVLLTITVVI